MTPVSFIAISRAAAPDRCSRSANRGGSERDVRSQRQSHPSERPGRVGRIPSPYEASHAHRRRGARRERENPHTPPDPESGSLRLRLRRERSRDLFLERKETEEPRAIQLSSRSASLPLDVVESIRSWPAARITFGLRSSLNE
ncbi:hypothetical protein PUN28_016698 [Cardiocondyla obscurior]|uniref:Uncharacterized protein n=1 Tax=Cardiocondyla obscurior TaxID=286306 RepID=A0AAW2ENF4_9HYME